MKKRAIGEAGWGGTAIAAIVGFIYFAQLALVRTELHDDRRKGRLFNVVFCTPILDRPIIHETNERVFLQRHAEL